MYMSTEAQVEAEDTQHRERAKHAAALVHINLKSARALAIAMKYRLQLLKLTA